MITLRTYSIWPRARGRLTARIIKGPSSGRSCLYGKLYHKFINRGNYTLIQNCRVFPRHGERYIFICRENFISLDFRESSQDYELLYFNLYFVTRKLRADAEVKMRKTSPQFIQIKDLTGRNLNRAGNPLSNSTIWPY